MQKAIVFQCPKKFYDVVNVFYDTINATGLVDKFYLITDDDRLRNLGENCFVLINEDLNFSSNILELVKHVKEDIFMLCIEDMIWTNPNKQEWEQAWNFVENNPKAGFLRLRCHDKVMFKKNEKGKYSEFEKSYKYYISLQPALWRKEYLLWAFKEHEDAWALELNGAKRAAKHPFMRSFGSRVMVYDFINAYKSGKYIRSEFYELMKKKGVSFTNKYDIYRVLGGKPQTTPFPEQHD
jgi:hypothetical protein